MLAAVVAVMSGTVVAKLEWHNVIAAYSWLPWILIPLIRRPAPTRRAWSRPALCAVCRPSTATRIRGC